MLKRWTSTLMVLVAAAVLATGCAKSGDPSGKAKETGKDKQAAKKEHKHDGWWCDEHGVPEEVCSMCSAKVAKAFKDKGDWCKDHDRAKSQCFICDASLKDKFAAQYKAKLGKNPPEPEENMPKQ